MDSITAPLTRPLLATPGFGVATSGLVGLSFSQPAVSGYSTLKSKLISNAGDLTVLDIGDSTMDGATEWVARDAANRAAEFPQYSVDSYAWGTTDYGAVNHVSVGTGPDTLTYYRCALSGSTMNNFMGSLFPAAIGNIQPDLIRISMGHNYIGLISTVSVLLGQLIQGIEQIMLAHPGVPVVLVLQHPRRDDTQFNQIVTTWTEYAAARGDILTVDFHAPIVALGKPSGIYADSIHLNDSGNDICEDINEATWAAAPFNVQAGLPAWLATSGTNILSNGKLDNWPGAVPVGWALAGNGVLTKDISIVAPGKTQSAKHVNGSTTSSLSQAAINFTSYQLQYMTLWAHLYIEVAASSFAGRTRFITNGASPPVVVNNPGNVGLGGWRYVMIANQQVPGDATTGGCYIYPHATAGQAGTIYIDEVGLNVGSKPRGIA